MILAADVAWFAVAMLVSGLMWAGLAALAVMALSHDVFVPPKTLWVQQCRGYACVP